MAQLDHLQLIRARVPIARRKTGGGGAPPGRGGGHGGALRAETQAAVAEQQAAKPAAFVDPSLLLRVQVDGHIAESDWEKLGLSVVSSDADRTVLLFSSTGDLTEFMDRLSKFDAPPANAAQKNPNYAGLVGRIDGIGGLAPRDRLGPWAATLDALARELDVLIVVSAGNRGRPRPFMAATSEELVTVYPTYLLEPENRLAEPAGAANVMTVGAVAGGTGLDARHAHDANVRPITHEWGEPSPFTRVGPGAGGVRKPDVVDLGGTAVFDVPSVSLAGAPRLPAAGVITLNHRYTEQFLTAAGGTSFAAPLLIHKAARLLCRMPNASANLLRALLVGAARSPDAFERRLGLMTAAERVRIGGNGVVDPIRAAYSDEHRVVLYAEDALEMDQFAVYRLPIPPEFRTGGSRKIRVSLAYDPPVRRTRNDYLGTKMDFRLLRGIDEAELFEHFRDRDKTLEGAAPAVPAKFKCKLQPGSDERANNTLQTASVTYKRATVDYGAVYYLVVRCLSHWAVDQVLDQRFAVVVELEHQPEIRIYNRVRERVQVRA